VGGSQENKIKYITKGTSNRWGCIATSSKPNRALDQLAREVFLGEEIINLGPLSPSRCSSCRHRHRCRAAGRVERGAGIAGCVASRVGLGIIPCADGDDAGSVSTPQLAGGERKG
jgi:hypothetical protein